MSAKKKQINYYKKLINMKHTQRAEFTASMQEYQYRTKPSEKIGEEFYRNISEETDDIKCLSRQYQSPEERIDELEYLLTSLQVKHQELQTKYNDLLKQMSDKPTQY